MRETKGEGYNSREMEKELMIQLEAFVNSKIEEYKKEYEDELSRKMKELEKELRGSFNKKIEELGGKLARGIGEYAKDLLKGVALSLDIEETSVPGGACDYLSYEERGGFLYITGLNEKGLNMTKITIPAVIDGKRVKSIESSAFAANGNLESVIIENGIEKIGERAFYQCKALKEIFVPDSVVDLQREAFRESKSLGKIRLSKSIKKLEYGVMYQTAIKEIELPEGLVEIGTHAFGGCYSLYKVNIPSTVTTIKNYAFWYAFHSNPVRGRVYIPAGVKVIEADAFGGGKNLDIYCATNCKPSTWNEKWNSSKYPVVWGVEE